jgi:hypothetical protein
VGRTLIVLLLCAPALADEHGETHGTLQLYVQPAPSDWLLVFTPLVSGRVLVRPWLRLDVHWTADVVTGATPRTYGPPDVVTAATRFSEVRNALGAGAEARVGPATLSAAYDYGIERDYRTHLVRGGVAFDLLRHNFVVAAQYSHSWSSVCDLAQAKVPVLERQPLDTSRGCFADTPTLTEESLDVDTAELSLTQTFTPKLIGALIGSYQHLDGFQSNPYRRVWLDGGRYQAQESHPHLRDRGALTGRLRYAVESLRATAGVDLRLYRDSWGVQSLTLEIDWDQPLGSRAPHWRYGARARGYLQSRAAFYRDAGEANSYDRAGPVGNYFTADQELAPLADLLVGGRFSYASSSARRRWRMFTDVEASLSLDWIKIFALSPQPPNVARTESVASALVLAASAAGRF